MKSCKNRRAVFVVMGAAMVFGWFSAGTVRAEPTLEERREQLEAALRQDPENRSALLKVARVYFYSAIDDEGYIPKAEGAFAKYVDKGGARSIAEMYQATLKTLYGKHASWPMEKWEKSQAGLKEMDTVVKKYPEDFEARFVYASTMYYLPFFFGRRESSLEALRFLAGKFPEAVTKADDPELVCNVGKFLLETGELGEEAERSIGEKLRGLSGCKTGDGDSD